MIKVLSVGAGIEQVKSIEIARKLGYEVIAIDKDKDAIGFSLASKAYAVDIADECEAIRVASEQGIQAIIPAPIGRYLTTVGAVNDALGLVGISKQAALYCTDKNLFQQATANAGLNRPKQKLITNRYQLHDALLSFGFPCIIKPRNGSGSRGIVAILAASQVNSAIEEHFHYNHNDDTLIEEFIEGPEFGIDGVVIDGQFQLIMVRGKELTALPYRQAVGMFSHLNPDESLKQELTSQLTKCVSAIGLDNCLLHADVIVNRENKAFILEIAGRPAGLNISSMLIPYAIGVSFLEEGLKLVLRQTTNFSVKWQKSFAFRFMEIKGSAKERDNLLQAFPEIVDIHFAENISNKQGTKITCGADVISGGFLMTSGQDYRAALDNNDRILAKISVGSES